MRTQWSTIQLMQQHRCKTVVNQLQGYAELAMRVMNNTGAEIINSSFWNLCDSRYLQHMY